MLLARIYEAFPLTCPQCGTQMRTVAFITEATPVQRILEHTASPLLRRGSPQHEGRRHGRKTAPLPPFSMKSALRVTPSPSRSRNTNSISA